MTTTIPFSLLVPKAQAHTRRDETVRLHKGDALVELALDVFGVLAVTHREGLEEFS